jgi:hypothetical protein
VQVLDIPAQVDDERAGPFDLCQLDLYQPVKPGDAFNCISK